MRKASKLKRLYDYMDTLILKRQPLVIYNVLACVYDDLDHSGVAEFITEEVRDILFRCGIETKPKGIGWIATI